MTYSEFLAWLEGYTASFKNGSPNAKQWAEVQERLKMVSPPPPPYYLPMYTPYPVYREPVWYWWSTAGSSDVVAPTTVGTSTDNNVHPFCSFDGTTSDTVTLVGNFDNIVYTNMETQQ